jgi:hypothetical protein
MNYNKIYQFIITILILVPIILFGQEKFDKNRIYPAPVGDKAGYIDYTGQFVIAPMYSRTRDFDPDNRAAIVSKETKSGIIDLQGEILVPIVYHSLRRIKTMKDTDGYLYIANIDDKYGVINLRNQIVIPLEYDYINPETEFFIVRKDRKVGVLNLSNEVIIDLEYGEIHQHTWEYDGFLVKGANDKWALFEKDGKQLCNPIFDNRIIAFTASYINGFSKEKSITIDYYGMVHPKLDFDVFGFEKGHSIVQTKDDLYGLIDEDFNFILEPLYEDLLYNENIEDNTILLFREKGKWGIMNLNGTVLFLPECKGIIQVSKTIFGLSLDDTGYRLFDLSKNQWMITQKYYDIVGDEEAGIIEVNTNPDQYWNGIWGLLNFEGETILEPAKYSYYVENDVLNMSSWEDRNSWGFYSLEKEKLLIPPIFDLTYYETNHLIKVYYWIDASKDYVAYFNHEGEIVWAESGSDIQQRIDDFYKKNPQYAK